MSEGRFREKIRRKNLEFAMNVVAMFLSYSLSLREDALKKSGKILYKGKSSKIAHIKGFFYITVREK